MIRLAQKEHLIVPAHVDHLANLRDFVVQIGEKYRFSHKLINAFKLAVDEAATNIIEHAYGENEGYITIQAIVRRKSLTINLIDQGIYFDPKWVKSPDVRKNLDDNVPTGLGIFMMRRLMDRVNYCKTQAGNELSLSKVDTGSRKKPSLFSAADLPTSLKMVYFLRVAFLLAIIHVAGFSYFYYRVDEKLASAYFQSGHKISKRLAKQLSGVRPELLGSPDGADYIKAIMLPVYDENLSKIYSLVLEDTLGNIGWSTISSEIGQPLHRPEGLVQLPGEPLSYKLDGGSEVFDFEQPLSAQDGANAFKSVHVLLLGRYLEAEIHTKTIYYIKLTVVSFGLSYGILLFLSYLVTYPLRKLSRWVQDVRKGDVRNDLDIDTTSEIGEIAHAFTDITEKYHESQKHLATREKFEKEIHLAHDVQRALLPEKTPSLDTLEIKAYYAPAETVSGDFYDFIDVDQDSIGVAVADVSGKGVPGSMVMTLIRTALRTEARGHRDAAEVLRRVNEFVSNDMARGLFVTVYYVVIDTKNLTLNFASAGHTPMIVHRGSSGLSFYINPVGFPIGLKLPQPELFSSRIESGVIQLEENDTVVLYTDGLTEAMNSKRALFGEERLLKAIRKHHADALPLFVEHLKNAVYSFGEDTPQHDDITLVAIRRKTRQPDENSDAASPPADESLSLEAQFLSLEETTRVLDIITAHPEYEAEEIQRTLKTKRYQVTEIELSRIEDELRRRGLHTSHLRYAFAEMYQQSDRELRPPGTPRLNLTGSVRMTRKKRRKPKLRVAPDGGVREKIDEIVPKPHKADAEEALPVAVEPAYRQNTPPSSEIAPDNEADFVFGDFIDDLISVTERPRPGGQSPEPPLTDLPPDQEIKAGSAPADSDEPLVDELEPDTAALEKAGLTRDAGAEQVVDDGTDEMPTRPDSEKMATPPASHGIVSGENETPSGTEEPSAQQEVTAGPDDISDSLIDNIFEGYVTDPGQTSSEAEYESLLTLPQEALSKGAQQSDVVIPEADAAEKELDSESPDPVETAKADKITEQPDVPVVPETVPAQPEDAPEPETDEFAPVASELDAVTVSPIESLTEPPVERPSGVSPITELVASELEDRYFQRSRRRKPPSVIEQDDTHDVPESGPALANALLAAAYPLEAEPASPEEMDTAITEEPAEAPDSREVRADDSYFSSTIEDLLETEAEADIFDDFIPEAPAPGPEVSQAQEREKVGTEDVLDSLDEIDLPEAQSAEIPEEPAETDANVESVFDSFEADDAPEVNGDQTGPQPTPDIVNDDVPDAESNQMPEPDTEFIVGDTERLPPPPFIPDEWESDGWKDAELEQLLHLGIQRYREKNYEEAIIYFKKVLKVDPEFHDVYAMLGNAYFRNDMLAEAVVCYEQLKVDGQADTSTRENLALIYWKLGAQQMAVEEWQEILRNNPERADIKKRLERVLGQAPTASAAGTTTSAGAASSAELSGNGQNGDAHARKALQEGIDCYRKRDYESAIRIFRQAIEHFSDKNDGYAYLANAYFRRGMYDEAAEIYERLEEMELDTTRALENLGLIRVKQGRYAAAVAEWTKALQRNPERTDLKRKIDIMSELF